MLSVPHPFPKQLHPPPSPVPSINRTSIPRCQPYPSRCNLFAKCLSAGNITTASRFHQEQHPQPGRIGPVGCCSTTWSTFSVTGVAGGSSCQSSNVSQPLNQPGCRFAIDSQSNGREKNSSEAPKMVRISDTGSNPRAEVPCHCFENVTQGCRSPSF